MVALARIQEARLFRHLPAQYLLPIALLLAVSFGCLFALLFHLTSVQDEMAREQEIELVRNSLESATRLAEHDLRDYAVWDEGVIRLVQRFDRVWADDNLGPYLGQEQQYDYVMVLDGSDRPIYTYHDGMHRAELDPVRQIGPAFAASLRQVRDLDAAATSLISGYSRSGTEVYLYAVASVVPLTDKIALPPGRTTAIAIARKVDAAFLGELSSQHHTPRLQLDDSRLPAGWLDIQLVAQTGERIANIAWLPEQPGSALRREIWPAFILVSLISFAFAGLILRSGRRAVEALQFSETRAQHLAKHDLLTGLPNRRALHEQLQEQLDTQDAVALLYLDLDGFKETNDVYGHGAGDELLRAVAFRLAEIVPANSFLARVGGDEFAVIAPALGEARQVAGAILEAFSSVFSISGFRVSLGVSIGVASSASVKSADELVRRADAAMYEAKSRGKHCFQLYNQKIDAGRELRKQLEHDLRLAVEHGDIDVLYQPIVAAGSGVPVCVEALARWNHHHHGPISPEQFIPIAEESGLIVALGRNVLAKACRETRDWNVDLAVNLSPAQFWDRGLAATIRQVLAETGFPPARLELEITEGYLMRRPEAARDVLRQLKSMGVRIALDDFGTGFASIGYLQRLGFDSIKIDRSFVAAAVTSSKAADLARAIVAMGEALDLPVTAEGVETVEQSNLMTAAGCERLQGWLFGRPMAEAEAAGLFATPLRLAS